MKRLLPFIIAILLVIGCLVAPFLLFRPENYRKPLIDQLSKIFRHPVLIDKIEAHYFPPQLILHQLNVLKGDHDRYLIVDNVTLTMGWSALFGQSALPSKTTFSGAHIVINRLQNGAWDYSEWVPLPGGNSGNQKTLIVVIVQSDIRFIDAFAPSQAEILAHVKGAWNGIPGEFTLVGDLTGSILPETFALTLQNALGPKDRTGTFILEDGARKAVFEMSDHAGQRQIHGVSPEWRLDSAAAWARFYLRLPAVPAGAGSSFLRDWKTDFTALGSSTTFTHSAMVDGGTTEFKGTIAEHALKQVSLTAAVQNVPVASLKPLLGGLSAGVDGKLTGVVSRFELPVSSMAWENAKGEFVFELADGSYRFPDSTLQALKKVKTARYLRKKFPEFEDKGFPFTKLRVQGVLQQGALTLEEAAVISGDVRAAATGRLEAGAQSLDLWLELQIHEVLPHLRKELPERYVYGEPGREKIQPIFGRMQGLWSEWKLRALPRSKVPGAAQKKLRAGLTL